MEKFEGHTEKAADYRQDPPTEQRPQCPWCGKRLVPRHRYTYEPRRIPSGFRAITVDHGFNGEYLGYHGMFDRLRCGAAFGAAAAKAGFRIKE